MTVVIGNIPSLVLLRHEHANRYLETLAPEFPNLVLVDVRALNHALEENGLTLEAEGREIRLRREDVFADREHPNGLGSVVLANLLLAELKARFADELAGVAPLDLTGHVKEIYGR